MKKFSICLLIIVLSFSVMPIYTTNAKATTLREQRKELAALQAKYNSNQNKKAQSVSEQKAAQNNIYQSHQEIESNKEKIEKAKLEIEQLNIDIAKTEETIKELVKLYQLTKGENLYLEYVFNSESYADLVYRYTLVKQIASYNQKQLNDFEDQIAKNEQLKKDLAGREADLEKLIDKLEVNINTLSSKIDKYEEEAVDIQTDINSAKELIDYLVKVGCKEDDNIEKCLEVNGAAFWLKPLTRGVVSSYFGYRKNPITGAASSFHTGIDLAGNSQGTNVYATASGTVGKILRKQSCGGNMVYIYHTVAGKKYTTVSMHLYEIKVSLGQKVTTNTVVGTVGGGSKTPWDKCSTGPHLHLGLATGWYGTSCSSGCYTTNATYRANLINPKDVFKFPDKGTYWSKR